MVYREPCPHCQEQTEIEQPTASDIWDGETVELHVDCTWCEKPIVAEFRIEFVMRGVRRG